MIMKVVTYPQMRNTAYLIDYTCFLLKNANSLHEYQLFMILQNYFDTASINQTSSEQIILSNTQTFHLKSKFDKLGTESRT